MYSNEFTNDFVRETDPERWYDITGDPEMYMEWPHMRALLYRPACLCWIQEFDKDCKITYAIPIFDDLYIETDLEMAIKRVSMWHTSEHTDEVFFEYPVDIF